MTAANRTSSWIRFDGVEIDGDGHRLLVNGVEVPVERKAFAVLVLLAAEPGRLFTRDEILQAVWGHAHVTPGVLNRVITLLRQALGESASAHRYLHTVHGVGYRFDAVVSTEPPRSTVSAVVAPLLSVESSETVTVAGEIAEAPRRVGPRARPLRRFGAADALVLAFGTLLLLLAWLFVVSRSTDREAAPVAAVQPALVVLPLRPVGSEQDERALADGLSEELTTRLSHIDGLHLISSTSAMRAQSEGFDLQQLSQRLQVTHALEGSLRQSGQRLRIDLRLLELPGGRTLWAQDFDRDLADVFAIQREIAQAVAGALTLRLGLHEAHRTEVDTDAFRAYLEARRLMRLTKDTLGARARAGQILRTNLTRNPDDARSRALLALLLTLRDYSRSDDSEQHLPEVERNLQEGRAEATAALALDANLVDAHEALANVACAESRWSDYMQRYRRALDLDPTNFALRSSYAARLGTLGYLDEALRESEIGLASEPLSYEASFQRGRMLDTLGRHEEARVALEAASQLWPEQPWRVNYARWFNAIWRNDPAPMRELAATLPDADAFRPSYLAVNAALLDPTQWPYARQVIVQSEAQTGTLNFLHVLLPQFDAAHVVNGFEPALRDAFPSYYLMLWQPEYASLREDPSFSALLQRMGIIEYWNANGWPRRCRAHGDGVTCE
ncbi:MAG: winged helix-turn-helix domain-containing protein [Dokdonella sp.]